MLIINLKNKNMPILTDLSKMPYGQYQGDKMETIPDHYLLWLYENNKCRPNTGVLGYIVENLDAIKHNIKNSKR